MSLCMVKLLNIDVRHPSRIPCITLVVETISQGNLLFNEVSLHFVNRLLIDEGIVILIESKLIIEI